MVLNRNCLQIERRATAGGEKLDSGCCMETIFATGIVAVMGCWVGILKHEQRKLTHPEELRTAPGGQPANGLRAMKRQVATVPADLGNHSFRDKGIPTWTIQV